MKSHPSIELIESMLKMAAEELVALLFMNETLVNSAIEFATYAEPPFAAELSEKKQSIKWSVERDAYTAPPFDAEQPTKVQLIKMPSFPFQLMAPPLPVNWALMKFKFFRVTLPAVTLNILEMCFPSRAFPPPSMVIDLLILIPPVEPSEYL